MTNIFDDLRFDNWTIIQARPQKCSCALTDIIKHFRRGTHRLYKDAVGDSDAIGQVLIASLQSIDR